MNFNQNTLLGLYVQEANRRVAYQNLEERNRRYRSRKRK